ncbi:MAG: signal transduction histidine-protein kinase/phosphatase DegS, partial [Bacteroidota bacterium]
AQELHDGIGAAISGLRMNIDWLLIFATQPDIIDKLNKTNKGLNEVIVELREISHNLQPAFFGNKLLYDAVKDYADQLSLKNKCKFDVYVEGLPDNMNANLKLNCYRILSELMQNIFKHANATIASVQVIGGLNELQMIIDDNGVGFNVNEKNDGIGLINIKNRVHICNGKINIDSSSLGTSIIIDLPL